MHNHVEESQEARTWRHLTLAQPTHLDLLWHRFTFVSPDAAYCRLSLVVVAVACRHGGSSVLWCCAVPSKPLRIGAAPCEI